jgi:imidazolonepropionase-like amidohydrolase
MSGARRLQVFTGARLFDGLALREDCALVVEDGVVREIAAFAERPRDGAQHDLGGGVLAPGLVDWQVNGGGGVLFNATPTSAAIAAIAAAHRREGTTAILPTVITDAPEVLAAALEAAREAVGRALGAFGVHVEGPYIDARRKGVHAAEFVRKMRDKDAAQLVADRGARRRRRRFDRTARGGWVDRQPRPCRGERRRGESGLRRRRERRDASLQRDDPADVARARSRRRRARRLPRRLRPHRRRPPRP